ncbi:MAG TPA: hemerythrin domain-containing protein [Burkholderiaceae bacterium]|nr:hemerythrin domain-containing protein [Burkholderiaceae bacterium]
MNAITEHQAPREALDRWHVDHHNFSRLLGLIEQQVDAFRSGRRLDLELLRLVVYYLRHHPDCFHHPREDVAFTRLVQRDPRLQLEIARRMQEHTVIAAAGEELLSCLDEIIAGAVVERTTLEKLAATYVVYYRHHLAAEERHVIPRAIELLTLADWLAIAAIPSEPDPLFGADLNPRYAELRRLISAATHID